MVKLSMRDNGRHSFPHDPSAAAFQTSLKQWLARCGWLLPVLIVIVVYYVAINNYFTSDDFMWLDRARTFKDNWLQIFRPDIAYFDPLIHIMFVIDYLIAGHNPHWYHCVDLAVHAANAFLVYRFARLLCDNERAAIYGGILFAGSFAIADAVFWSSSRVDLLATFFSMFALLRFLAYLRAGQKRDFGLSFLFFLLALGAKGTPLVLPLVFLWLIIQEKKPLRHAANLIPFAIAATAYLALLKLTAHLAALPVDIQHFTISNILVALCTLFIPGHTLTHLNLAVTASLLFITISVLCLPPAPFTATSALRRTGYFILLSAIVPVLVIGEFTLVTKHSNFVDLMGSPSHRIYLASVGVALLGGGVLQSIETWLGNFSSVLALPVAGMLLLATVAANAYLVRERDVLWEAEGDKARAVVEFFDTYEGKVVEGSLISLIGFPHSTRAYMESTIKDQLGVQDATFDHYVDIGILIDDKTLQKAEISYLFVFGKDLRIHDLSLKYRQQLLSSRKAISDFNNYENVYAAQQTTSALVHEINLVLGL